MPPISSPAIILAAFRYGESSKILRLATESAGVQSAIAKGALRPRSRFGAALQVLSDGQAHLIIHPNRDLQLLTAFDLHRVRVGLAGDMERYASAATLAEVMLRFGSSEEHPESFYVLHQGLDLLETTGPGEVTAVGLAALWTLVSALGFEPSLDRCSRCGDEIADGDLPFDAASGGALCAGCSRSAAPARLRPGDRAHLEALVRMDDRLPALDAAQAAAHRRLLARYIQHHLGEGSPMPALDFWVRRPWGAA